MCCVILGDTHKNSKGVGQNFSKAAEFYKKDCDDDISKSCGNLGAMYEHGLGVKKDINKAVKYYAKACGIRVQEECENHARLKK
ncbi:MAG: sel1 repeat family protein [Campylobacteraceae bacterium]|nr:sel1 repeat family protein [Campylobacteraceae bacterium]